MYLRAKEEREKMSNFGVAHLANFWKIKDNCQEICLGLENLSEEMGDKNSGILNDYNIVKDLINKITATGYFSKAKDVSEDEVVSLVNEIASIEEKDKIYTAHVWAKNLSKVDAFKQNVFKLCVKPYFDSNIMQNLTNMQSSNFVQAHLISNGNIILKNPANILNGGLEKRLPYGFVYNVDESNFVGATDESMLLVSKNKADITDKDYVSLAEKNGECIFLSGYASKLKTPGQIIRKYSNKRFSQNDNLVVLDGESKPCAIFYYSLGIDEIDNRFGKIKAAAEKLNLPLVKIDLNDYFKNNGKFFTTSNNIRVSFNNFVDSFNQVIIDSCDFDMLAESKKLVGYNTSLRYNFVYKFLSAIRTRLDEGYENMVEFVPKAFRKMVLKKNTLTKEREIANGAPLVYPNEETNFAVPNSFFNE